MVCRGFDYWHILHYNHGQPKLVELDHRDQEIIMREHFFGIVIYALKCQVNCNFNISSNFKKPRITVLSDS